MMYSIYSLGTNKMTTVKHIWQCSISGFFFFPLLKAYTEFLQVKCVISATGPSAKVLVGGTGRRGIKTGFGTCLGPPPLTSCRMLGKF